MPQRGRGDRPPARGADARPRPSDEPRSRASRRSIGAVQAGRREGAAIAEGDGQRCGCVWCRPGYPARRSADDLLRHPRRVRARAVRALLDADRRPAEHDDGARRPRRSATCCRAWCWRGWPSARAPDPAVARRRARPAGRQRRGRPRSRSGADARRRGAGVRLSRAGRRAEAGQPRAARRQGARPKRCATWRTAPASTTSARS